MTDYGPRSSYEPEWMPYTVKAAERVVRVTIGEGLQARHKVLQDLPPKMLALLTLLNEREE
jgi:hypothetical protein